VAKLVAGPRVYICDACVAIAQRLMNEADVPPAPVVRPSIWRRVTDAVARLVAPRRYSGSVYGSVR
jgi:hypothetical protein